MSDTGHTITTTNTHTRLDPIPLGGSECARCGLPAESYSPTAGVTLHLDRRKRPCRTQLPPGGA